VLQANMLPNSP